MVSPELWELWVSPELCPVPGTLSGTQLWCPRNSELVSRNWGGRAAPGTAGAWELGSVGVWESEDSDGMRARVRAVPGAANTATAARRESRRHNDYGDGGRGRPRASVEASPVAKTAH
jgi:hypothetical protein